VWLGSGERAADDLSEIAGGRAPTCTTCGSIECEHVGGVGIDPSVEFVEVCALNRFEAVAVDDLEPAARFLLALRGLPIKPISVAAM